MLTAEQGAALHGQIANALKDADDGLMEVVKTRLRRLQELVDDVVPDVDAPPTDTVRRNMSLVRVAWTETKEYEALMEVPDFDKDHGEPDDLRNAIGGLASQEKTNAEQGEVDIDITGHEVIREGDADV
jgi:hypothetical protein